MFPPWTDCMIPLFSLITSWWVFGAYIGNSDNQTHSHERDSQTVSGKVLQSHFQAQLSIGVLQEIGRRCCSKVGDTIQNCAACPISLPPLNIFKFCHQVEFRSVVSTSKDLQFSVEVRELL